jgi:hypothetical protein
MEIDMIAPTVRSLRRRTETKATKQPTAATANSADGIATDPVVIDKAHSPGKPNSRSTCGGTILESGLREKLVREAAYFRAERRGFSPGGELEDWIAAEREVDQALVAGKVAPVRFSL